MDSIPKILDEQQLKLALAKFIQKNYTSLETLLSHVYSVIEELQFQDKPNPGVLNGRKIDKK